MNIKVNNKKAEERCKKLKLTMEEYIAYLIDKDLNEKVNLGKGFYYNNSSKKVYNKSNNDIKMTATQLRILLLLLENKGKILSAKKITVKAWDKKDISIFTLRNMIKQIRDKTYYEIIKSHSNIGYSINDKI